MQFPSFWASERLLFLITFIDQWTQFLKKLIDGGKKDGYETKR